MLNRQKELLTGEGRGGGRWWSWRMITNRRWRASWNFTDAWHWWQRFSSVQWLSHVQLFVTPWTATCQASCPLLSPRVCSNSYPLNWWCHPPISSSVISFSSCRQSFPTSGSFPLSQFFPSGGQSIGVSASTSVLPMNIQDWSPLGWTGLISLQSKGLSRVFSNTTVQKHQFFSAQLSLWSNFIFPGRCF